MPKHQGKGIRLLEAELERGVPDPSSRKRLSHFSEATGFALDLYQGFVTISKDGRKIHVPAGRVLWCRRPPRGRVRKDSPYSKEGPHSDLAGPPPTEETTTHDSAASDRPLSKAQDKGAEKPEQKAQPSDPLKPAGAGQGDGLGPAPDTEVS